MTAPPPETNHENEIFLVNKIKLPSKPSSITFRARNPIVRSFEFLKGFADKFCYWILNITTGAQITYLGVHAFYLLSNLASRCCSRCTSNGCRRDHRGQVESAGHRSVIVAALTGCGSSASFHHGVLRCLPLRTCWRRSAPCMAVPGRSR